MQDALTERCELAKRIKTARHRSDLTKNALSDLVGIDPATYAKLEVGASEPKVSVLKKIAIHTNQDPVWLFLGDDTNNTKE